MYAILEVTSPGFLLSFCPVLAPLRLACLTRAAAQGNEFGADRVSLLHLRMCGLKEPREEDLSSIFDVPLKRDGKVCEVPYPS